MDITTYALSKKIAAHAVSGVQSMSVSGQTLTINTKDSGVLTMTFPTPKDGVSVTDIDVNANNQIVFTMSDGTEFISGKIPTVKGDKGEPFKYSDFTQEQLEALKGADGFSPSAKVEKVGDTATITITDKDGTTTATIKDGQGGSGGTGEENTIDSISINGVNVVPDENKNVDITVPNIYVGDTEPIDDNMEVWFNPNGESSSIDVPIEKIKVNGELQIPVNKVVDITVPSIEGLAKTEDIPTNISELTNDSGYLTEHQDISGKVDKVEGKSLIADTEIERLASVDNYNDTEVKTQIQAVANGLMDSVGYSADYKSIDIIAKNGVKKSVNVAPIISHASITELSDVDTTNKATGKALVYNATINKHEYADVSGTDEKVKMDASTDAKYLGELLDNITIASENGKLKVKKLDGQEVTITEINYLKGLTMNVMDLVNIFSDGGVKIINTPVATYAELLTIDKSSFIEGISYLVYVLADENHDNAKTTYLVDKDSEIPTYFGFADSQRDFTTNPIDLATEITGKLGIANMDSDAIKALFTVDDTYKTETATNNAFSTHGAKALYDELLLAIGNKANNSDLTAHKDDTDIHVSTKDRTKWDSAKTHADSAHAPSNAQKNVLETVKVNGTALTPSNKAVNIDLSNYAKKTDIPTTLPANGGNADTVNGHTVGIDVPENAKFTDTTYSDATQIEHGLMSVDDKKKLDGLKKYTPDGTTITADEDGTLHGQSVDIATTEKAGIVKPDGETIEVDADGKISAKTALDTKPTIIATAEPNIVDTLESPMLVTKATRNLLNPTEQTITRSGVTCTNNGDGTYTLNGTNTLSSNPEGTIWFYIASVTLPNQRAVILGSNNPKVGVYVSGKTPTIFGDRSVEISKSEYGKTVNFGIAIAYQATLNNVVVKPMITTDLSATYDDFVPYDGYEIKSCGKNIVGNPSNRNNPTIKDGIITFPAKSAAANDTYLRLYSDVDISAFDTFRVVVESIGEIINDSNKSYVIIKTPGKKEFSTFFATSFESSTNKYISNVFNCSDFGNKIAEITVVIKGGYAYHGGSYKVSIFNGEDKEFSNWEPYVESTVHITPSTEFPLLGLKSFDGETNIISPGNVEVAYAKNDSGKAILDVMESNETLISNAINHNIPRVVPKDITSYMSDGSFYKRLNGTDGYKLFEDIFVGDYIKMSRAISAPNQDSSVKTIGSQYVTIIGLDTLMGNGDGNSFVNYHHAVMTPGQGFGGTQHFGRHRMNFSDTTENGYVISEMNTAVIGAVATSGSTTDTATINQQLYAEFGSHLATTRELVTNSINVTGINRFGDDSGCSNNWEWASMQAILMSEIEVYGSIAFSSSGYDTGNAKMQMPLFAHNRQAMNNRSAGYWLKDIASETDYCNCNTYGNATSLSANNVSGYVRPRFVIKA